MLFYIIFNCSHEIVAHMQSLCRIQIRALNNVKTRTGLLRFANFPHGLFHFCLNLDYGAEYKPLFSFIYSYKYGTKSGK